VGTKSKLGLVESSDALASWFTRIAAVAVSSGATGWIMNFLHGPAWSVALAVICTASGATMVVIWVNVIALQIRFLRLNSAEIAADKQRKIERIDRWRSMLADVSKEALTYQVPDRIPIGMILRGHPDYLSLEAELRENSVEPRDTCNVELLGIILSGISREVSELERN
jgi:hypothetical protein